MIKVRFTTLEDTAVIPYKQENHDNDAAYDLTATSVRTDEFGHLVYGTGIALEIPKGYAGYVYPRSSVRKHGLVMTNSVGVIDSDYRGELQVTFTPEFKYVSLWGLIKRALGFKLNLSDVKSICIPYKPGERIAQLVIRTAPKADFIHAEELTETVRGKGGHGSTGE